MNFQDFQNNDQSNHRTYQLENGNHLNLKRTDPYGFIYLSLDKGQMPTAYAGVAYTDWTQARTAAEKYIGERTRALAEIEEKNKDKPYTHPQKK